MENADDLPAEILQPLVQLGRALMTHARAHRDTTLAEHEQGVLDAWRSVAPLMLEGVLQVATTGLDASARPIAARCPGCQQRRSVQSRRGRHVQTPLGAIRSWPITVARIFSCAFRRAWKKRFRGSTGVRRCLP